MGILARVLLLPVTIATCISCSTETESDRTPSIQEAVPVVEGPVEVPLDTATQEVTELLRNLLAQARDQPESGARRGELGMAYDVNGFPDAAFKCYEQAESLDPAEARWPYYQALFMARWGQQKQALQALGRSIDRDSTYAPAWMWQGTWLLDVGQTDQADAAFRKAGSLGLEAASVAGQARVRLHQDRPEQALALLEPLSREARYPSVFQLLGRAYRETGRLDDARIALARGRSAQQLAWKDEWQDEKRIYEVGFHARVLHAKRWLRLGQTDQAVEALENLISERPDNAEVINQLSNAYAKIGEGQKAFWVLRRALERPPVHPSTHFNIAGFYEARGDEETALEHLDHAIELNPVMTQAHTRKGLLLQKQKRFEEALVAFETAMKTDATDPHLFFYAGDIEAILKRWPRAIQRFEEAVRVDASFTLGYLNLGLALARANRFDDAREALNWAMKLGTHDDDVKRALGYLGQLEERSTQ
jgi:tetratricopeptide (TPR) repeat protein